LYQEDSSIEILADGSEILLAAFWIDRVTALSVKKSEPSFNALSRSGMFFDGFDENSLARTGNADAVAFKAEFLRQAHCLAAAVPEELGVGVLWGGWFCAHVGLPGKYIPKVYIVSWHVTDRFAKRSVNVRVMSMHSTAIQIATVNSYMGSMRA
jgi:hypothetical protein